MSTKTKCPCCNKLKLPGGILKRRRNTCYENDEKNYITSCYQCFVFDCEMMEDLWSEYRTSQGFGDYDY